MKVFPERLAAQLGKSLAPLYWVAGDEILLCQEAADSIRDAAQQAGFSERKIFHPEKSEHWREIIAEANSLSLFAERSLIDIRTTPGKIDHAQLLDYLERPSPDTVLLISTGKVESSSQKTQWFKQLEQACIFVPVSPVESAQLPEWLARRARNKGLQLDTAALQLLAEHTDGNMLAADQELEKLTLQLNCAKDRPVAVSAEQISESVSDNARHSVFALNDALLAADRDRALAILNALRNKGDHPLAILGALKGDLRRLTSASELQAIGQSPASALMGLWGNRPALFQQALRRLTVEQTRAITRQLANIDQAVKGMHPRDPWELLQSLCLLLG